MTECAPSSVSNSNAGIAFGLVTAAGLSTSVGAALAFVMPKRTGTTNYFLAGSLGMAAGVMIYVSFVEIFGEKAVTAISTCVASEATAYLYATLCFFGGVAVTYLFDIALHWFERYIRKRTREKAEGAGGNDDNSAESVEEESNDNADSSKNGTSRAHNGTMSLQKSSQSIITSAEKDDECIDPFHSADEEGDPAAEDDSHDHVGHQGHMVAELYENNQEKAVRKSLVRMGIFTGIAIGFHNFPEGLATFVATLEDARVGAAVAIAIGIHNIPEGICIAMPIYYATGSRKKAFFWSTLSGVTELVGALLGWVALRKVFNQLVYGILFGVVAGMMVYISVKELLPMANRYDRNDKVTTIFFVLGMAIMAASLVLFKYQ